VGAAVQQAAQDARRQVLAIAADLLEASVDDLELADGQARLRGVPERAVSLRKVGYLSTDFGAGYRPVLGYGATAITTRAPGFAAHLAEVEVEPETGRVRVVRWLAVQDVGKAINPAAIEGQVRGAVAQGIGWALLEQMAFDESGRLQTATFMDYAVPGADHTPPVEVRLVEVPAEMGPFGAKQVGEPPIVSAAAAIANAVADATGHRFTNLPLTPERIVEALSG
jgi:CO/xanthine dehydrogenase Mo-binding subunit